MSVSLENSYDIWYDGTDNVSRFDLFIDSSADLSGLTHYDNVKLAQGSKATDISTGDVYRMTSAGSWILQPNEYVTGNYYTKTETEGRLSAHVCQCDTAGNVADKVATTSDDFVLREGAIISVKFTNTNSVTDSAAHPVTLNVNDSGAYRIIHGGGGNIGSGNPNLFGTANLYINYVFCNNAWVWISISYDTPKMAQSQATAGTSTTSMLVSPKIIHDSIISQTTPLQTTLADIINSGGKNRVQPTAASQTVDGITWTINADGTITADGTATANSYITVQVLPADSVFDGSYYLSGCPAGGSSSTHALYVARSSYTKYDYGSGVELTESTDGLNKNLIAIVYNGQTVDNIVFKPMICKKAYLDISTDFEPYCPTLSELYQLVKSYHP